MAEIILKIFIGTVVGIFMFHDFIKIPCHIDFWRKLLKRFVNHNFFINQKKYIRAFFHYRMDRI